MFVVVVENRDKICGCFCMIHFGMIISNALGLPKDLAN